MDISRVASNLTIGLNAMHAVIANVTGVDVAVTINRQAENEAAWYLNKNFGFASVWEHFVDLPMLAPNIENSRSGTPTYSFRVIEAFSNCLEASWQDYVLFNRSHDILVCTWQQRAPHSAQLRLT